MEEDKRKHSAGSVGKSSSCPLGNVLIVDDDQNIRSYLRIALSRSGYQTATAANVQEARKLLQTVPHDSFTCVITDYLMPVEDGLALLAWIQATDPELSTILATCHDQRELITESLRGGAVDFLAKPIDRPSLLTAVERAVARTRRQRARAQAQGAIQNLARAQKRILAFNGAGSPMELNFHPKHEAGGDFLSHLQISPGMDFYVLTDVSGHDLEAAYVSAYFHGMLRGMLANAGSVEKIIAYFNRFLIEEWNRPENFLNTSIAICAVLMDGINGTAEIWNNGSPSPICITSEGSIHTVGNNGGSPLGWFGDVSTQSVLQSMSPGDQLLMWTDGLVDLAEKQGVNPVSLAYAIRFPQGEGEGSIIRQAADDILVTAIRPRGQNAAEIFEPVLFESYNGSHWAQIDSMQSHWERSLKLALPALSETTLLDILLATREAVLNALVHGCKKQELHTASVELSYSASSETFRLSVRDSGHGHNFDLAAHEQNSALNLVEHHRGLILMKNLASRFQTRESGRWVIMDFPYPTQLTSLSS